MAISFFAQVKAGQGSSLPIWCVPRTLLLLKKAEENGKDQSFSGVNIERGQGVRIERSGGMGTSPSGWERMGGWGRAGRGDA